MHRHFIDSTEKMVPTTWKETLLYLAALFLISFILYLSINTNKLVSPETLVFLEQQENGGCNLFSGRWVYDDVSYPLYKERNCSFLQSDFTCEKYGKKNLRYQNWRWQPHHCNLPRFNGTAILEKLRNKRMIFVGDSLNRNQWRSFLCLIEPHLPPSTNKKLKWIDNFLDFHVEDYNATIKFYWAPFLVESNRDNISHYNELNRMIQLKSIEKHGQHWIKAHVLIFDTFAWWQIPELTFVWGSFERADTIYKKMKVTERQYEVALNTWSDWLEFHVDRNKTKLFFMSPSPYRLGKTHWGSSPSCHYATEPILDKTYWPTAPKRSLMEKVESTIEKLGERGVKVEYLNITQLSGYREDAHPSIYKSSLKSADKVKDPNKYSDCVHWCLPGVPDVWNEILYSYIMKP